MTLFGWDMSHYDSPSIGNAVGQGIRFFTHKAGGDLNDTELDEWWANVHSLPADEVMLGAYWVLYPGNPRGRAAAFIDRLDAVCHGWRDRPFILQVDCENWGGNTNTVPPKSDIRAFCDHLVELMPKLHPIVYAPEWTYHNTLAGLPYPLWASNYGSDQPGYWATLYPGDNSSRWGAYSGQTPAILQYSSKALVGGQATSDVNAFRGTFDDLVALLAPGWWESMDLTAANLSAIGDEVDKRIKARLKDIGQAAYDVPVVNARKNPDGSDQVTKWGEFDRYDDPRADRSDALQRANTAALLAAVTALGKTEAVDVGRLAELLAPAVASAVLAGLPDNLGDLTPAELHDSFLSALRDLVGATPHA